jgi:hypothetical protein
MLVTEPDFSGRAFFSISAGESPSVESENLCCALP